MVNRDFVFRVGDPRAPVYLLADVARYTQLYPSKAWRWARWIPGRDIDTPTSVGLSFLDLISMLIMRELRRYGVKARRIKRAEQYLTRVLGPYPLARNAIWTDGDHILFNPDSPLSIKLPRGSRLVSADMEGQQAFVEIIHIYLRHIEYNKKGLAIAWTPKEGIKLDPLIQFGQPCILGTRVTTTAIYSSHMAGETIETIAHSYTVSVEDARAAMEWEKGLEQAAA